MARRIFGARRWQMRGISKDMVYTVRIAARLAGVSEPTFRKWGKDGLRIITDRRPHMVRGSDLIEHMRRRRAARQQPMRDGQLLCMRCKAPRDPEPTSLLYTSYTEVTGRLSGLCSECGARMGRFCRATEASNLAQTQTEKIKGGMQA